IAWDRAPDPRTDRAASEFPAKSAGNSWQSCQSPGGVTSTVINCLIVNPRTLYQVLEETARVHGDAPALRQPAPDGSYTVYSWNQFKRAAEEIAAGLVRLPGRPFLYALEWCATR